MPFAAPAISSAARNARRPQLPMNSHSAARNARRFQGGQEETTPLNSNRNDYEDIENPFKMPGEVSKFDKESVQECLTKTIIVIMCVIIAMLFLLICAILQWNGIGVGDGWEFPWFPTKVGVGWELPWFPNNKISDH